MYYKKPANKTSPYFHYGLKNSIKWDSKDKELFEWYLSDLVTSGKAKEVIRLNDSIVEGSSVESLRLGGARAGADALLVVNAISDVDRYNNSLGITYSLLVTAFFVPASELDSLVMLNATMWDVRNGYLYLSTEAEHVEHQTRPAYFIDVKGSLKTTKAKALKVLGEDVRNRKKKMR